MRLGVIAAIVFIVLSMGILYGSVTNNNAVVAASVQESMESSMSAAKVVQEGDWGNFITLLAAPFNYFDSLVNIAYQAFNTPIFATGGWAIVPYFTVTPLIMVFFFGMILLLIGILTKST